MSKQGGMGDYLLIDEFDVSGDIGSLQRIACPMTVQEVPAIRDSAQARIGLLHDGGIDFATYWNPVELVTADSEHEVLRGRTTNDRIVSYMRGTTLGNPVASLVSKQLNYDLQRAQDGSLTGAVSTQGNKYGLAWGNNLTAGKKTDTTGSNGSGVDLTTVSLAFGWSAFLHVTAFTGTSAVIKIQDSADNAAWTDLAGAAFTAATAKTKERIQSAAATDTTRRYFRVVSSGTFTSITYMVNFVRYEIGGQPR
jgi:hypothetical protein